jgi:hypothetical protein
MPPRVSPLPRPRPAHRGEGNPSDLHIVCHNGHRSAYAHTVCQPCDRRSDRVGRPSRPDLRGDVSAWEISGDVNPTTWRRCPPRPTDFWARQRVSFDRQYAGWSVATPTRGTRLERGHHYTCIRSIRQHLSGSRTRDAEGKSASLRTRRATDRPGRRSARPQGEAEARGKKDCGDSGRRARRANDHGRREEARDTKAREQEVRRGVRV